MTKDNNIVKVQIIKNSPVYRGFLGLYVVDYSVDGVKSYKIFDTYKEGIDWLKTTFPKWFAKHYVLLKK